MRPLTTMKTLALALAVGVTLTSLSVTGQTNLAVNPTMVQFVVSTGHDATYLDGTPVVARYELRVYLDDGQGTTATVTQDLGKPTPDASRTATVTLSSLMKAACTAEIKYVAKVVAIGSRGGEGASANSNPFGFSDPSNKAVPPASGVVVR